MAGITDVGGQTSGLPTYQSATSTPTNPYDDPAFAQASFQQTLRGGRPEQTPSLIGGALSSAYHGTLGELGGAAQAVGQATGMKGVADWGSQIAQDQAAAAQAGGRPELEGQWGSLPGFAYNLVKQVPMLAGIGLASKFGGGALASRLGISAEAGGALAGGAAMLPSSIGGNVEAAKAANNGQLSTEDALKAIVLGVPEAAAQAYMPGSLAKVLEKGSEGRLGQRLLMGGAINGVVGAGQGAVTTALTGFMDPNKSIADRASDVVQGAMAGGIGGAALGAVIHGLSPRTEAPKIDPSTPTEDLSAATASLDPDKPAAPAAPEPEPASAPAPAPVPLVAANDQPGVTMLTPEETTARAPQVAQMRKDVATAYNIKGEGGKAFLDGLQATNQPELIKQVRDQATTYLETKKGAMPKWFERLATDVGVLDKDGNVVQDVGKSAADYQTLADTTVKEAQDKFQAAQADLANEPPKQAAIKLKNAAAELQATLAEAANHRAEAARLGNLVTDHATADTLPDVFSRRDVPDSLKDKPQENELWQHMMNIAQLGSTKDVRTDAAQAAVAIKRGDPKAIDAAKKVQDAYTLAKQERMSVKTDNAAPKVGENDLVVPDAVADRPDIAPLKVDTEVPLRTEAENSNTPDVMSVKTDEPVTYAQRPMNDNSTYTDLDTDHVEVPKTDAEVENERLDQGQEAAPSPNVTNDNIGPYPNLRPSPEALAFARDHSDYVEPAAPAAVNKNQTPKQQAAVEKGKATRAANKAAKETEKQATPPASDPDILAKLAEPTVKRQGDDDIAYLVGNRDKPVNSSADVLDHLAQNGDSDFVKLVASRLKKLGVDPTVSFGTAEDINAAAPGFDTHGLSAAYDEKNNHIWLVDRNNLQSNFLHEAIHAATHAQIDAGGPLVDRLAMLRDRAQKYIDEKKLDVPYGLTDLHEFTAEAFSNPEFQKLLADVPSARKTWTLWEAFKDAIGKLLNLPERARSLLDDVIGTGSSMMDAYAGHPAKPGSVADSNVHATVFAKRADDVLNRARETLGLDGKDGNWLAGETRKIALGWNTFTHIVDMYGRVLPSLQRLKDAREARDIVQARLHQTHKVARDMFETLPQAAKDATNTLMGWTRYNIDPRKTWEEHTHLHELKNADQMRALVVQARNDWNHAKNVGGDAAQATYNALDFSNKADHYMKLALLAHEYGSTAFRDLNRPEFARNFGVEFAHDSSGIHTDPQLAMEFWKKNLSDTLGTIQNIRDSVVSPKLNVGTKDEQKSAKRENDEINQLVGDVSGRLKQLDQAPYFHEGRQGEYYVSGKLNLGDDKQLIPSQVSALQAHLDKAGFGQYGLSHIGDNPSIFMRVGSATQMTNLRDALAEAQKKGWLDKDAEITHGMPGRVELWNSVAPAYVKRMVDLAARSPNFSKQAEAELRSRWLDMLSAGSIAKQYQTRTEAQGWNKDMMHNFVVRADAAAKSLSGAAMHGEVSDTMAQMDNEVQAHKAGDDPKKTIAAQQVANEITTREMQRSWHVDTTFVDHIRALNHTFHLGISLPYVTEQLSQIPMLLLPELGKTHGFVKSAMGIGKVTGMAFNIMKAVATGSHAADAVITPETLRKGGIDEPTVKFMMDIVNRSGLDLSSFTREYGVAARGGGEGLLSKVTHMGNVTAIYAETFGRVLSALAARELHGADKPGNVEYAKQVLDQAMMSWQPWNTSRMTSKTGIAGQLSPLMLSFTGYQTRMLEKLYREVHDAFGGETAQERAASRKFLAMHLGAATVIAGTLGMPFMTAFAGATSKLANFLTGKDDIDVEASYREFLAHTFGKEVGQAIAKGPLSAAGLDFSDLGDQKLLPFTNFLADRRKMEDSVADWAKDALGSPFATALNAGIGLRDIGHGLPMQGIAKMLPTALKGPFDAYRVANYGYEDKNGTQKPVPTDVRDVLARVAGFHTTSETEYNDKSRIAAGLNETRLEREQAIKQRLLLASAHSDPQAYQAAAADAAQFGRDHPLFQPLATFGTARSKQLLEQARARALGMPLANKQKEDIEQAQRLNW